MITVRLGMAVDIERMQAFYAVHGSSARISSHEQWVLAEDEDRLIGVVRLCTEHGQRILRTMRVSDAYQRQGIGKRMLRVLVSLLQGHACYCLPFAHPVAFYGGIGFAVMSVPAPLNAAVPT